MYVILIFAFSLAYGQTLLICSGRGSCKCYKGYSGQFCQFNGSNKGTKQETDFCSQNVIGFKGNVKLEELCKPNGKCKNARTGAICVCKESFSGTLCKDTFKGRSTTTTTTRKPTTTTPVSTKSEKILLVGSYWSEKKAAFSVEYYFPDNPRKNFVSKRLSKFGRTEHAAGMVGDFVLLVGGRDPQAPVGMVSEIEVYAPNQNVWKIFNGTDYARNYVAGAVLDGIFYICGGMDKWHRSINFCTSWLVKNNQLIHGRRLPIMKTPRMSHAAVALKGKLYVLGGYSNGILNSVEYFQPKSDSWTSVRSMRYKRMDLSAAVLGDHIFACGGYGTLRMLKSCESYSITRNQWNMVGEMKNSRAAFALVEFNGDLIALGGDLEAANTTEFYDKKRNRWRNSRRLLTPRSYFTAIVL